MEGERRESRLRSIIEANSGSFPDYNLAATGYDVGKLEDSTTRITNSGSPTTNYFSSVSFIGNDYVSNFLDKAEPRKYGSKLGRPVSFSELIEAAQKRLRRYKKKGYGDISSMIGSGFSLY